MTTMTKSQTLPNNRALRIKLKVSNMRMIKSKTTKLNSGMAFIEAEVGEEEDGEVPIEVVGGVAGEVAGGVEAVTEGAGEVIEVDIEQEGITGVVEHIEVVTILNGMMRNKTKQTILNGTVRSNQIQINSSLNNLKRKWLTTRMKDIKGKGAAEATAEISEAHPFHNLRK
jgi:hypothetical protein